jgi:hypothetical protein
VTTWTDTDRKRVMDRRYRKQRALRVLRGEPTSLTDATPARDHIRSMIGHGWSYTALEHMAEGRVTDMTLNNLASGVHATVERKTAATALGIPYTLAPTAAVPDEALVPTRSAQRRVHALLRLGWTHAALRAEVGTDTSHLARGSYQQMTAKRWRLVAAMYEELCMTPGPSDTTATRARAAGFAPPLAWTEIDDPDARPLGFNRRSGHPGDIDPVVVDRLLAGERVPSSRAEKEEAMRRWVAAGRSARSLAAIHQWNDGRYNPREDGAA